MAFVGLSVSEQAQKKLSHIKVPGENQNPKSYHCTLMYFGKEMLVKDIRKIIRVTAKIIENQRPFMVKTSLISKFSSDKDKYPIIAKLTGDKLFAMRHSLKMAYLKEKILFDDKFPDYNPHVTLSYANSKTQFKDIKIPPISWKIDKINMWYTDSSQKVKVELPFNKIKLYEIIKKL